jgi:hypothetical protein
VIRLRTLTVLVALAAGAVFLGCGGDDGSSPGVAGPAPPKLSNAVRLRHGYRFAGRRRRVDAQVSFGNVVDPYRSLSTSPGPNARFVAAQLRILNRGRDPFPIRWARFRGYDERGRPLPPGTQSTPLRRTMPDRPLRGQALTSLTAFVVPRGRRLESIRMTSIVRVWPFRARWTLAR